MINLHYGTMHYKKINTQEMTMIKGKVLEIYTGIHRLVRLMRFKNLSRKFRVKRSQKRMLIQVMRENLSKSSYSYYHCSILSKIIIYIYIHIYIYT